MQNKGWIGVDLDGTLAEYYFWQGPTHIGRPILPMVERVKKWLEEGQRVKIFTARVAPCNPERDAALDAIREWSRLTLGAILEVTAIKDYGCIAIYDDRAFRVEVNTGRVLSEPQPIGQTAFDFDGADSRERLIYQVWQCLEVGKYTESMGFVRMGPEQMKKAIAFLEEYEATNGKEKV